MIRDPLAVRATAFIQSHTLPLPVPSVQELTLYQASEVTPLWLMTECDLERDQMPPPFWAFAWAGGQALARYILDHPETVAGKRVLDIACGSGLVGIAAAKAGAAHVTCNDIDAYAEAAVSLNAGLNGVQVAFTSGDILNGDPPSCDVILAGDICYEKPMTDAMLSFFRRSLAQTDLGPVTVLVGDPHRTYFPKEEMARLARYDITTNSDIEDAAVKAASVWKMDRQ